MGVNRPEYSEEDRSSPELESLNCCQLKVHQKKIIRDRRKHHLDPTYDGPLKHRSCTDVICLLIFVVFIGAWVALGIFAFSSGTPGEIFAPRDTHNKKCGYDEGMVDKPYLVFFDLTKCITTSKLFTCSTPEVCVKECPTTNFYWKYYESIQGQLDISTIINRLICKSEFDKNTLKDWTAIKNAINSKNCAEWHLASVSVANRCLPDLTKLVGDSGGIKIEIDDGTGQMIDSQIDGVMKNDLAQGTNVVEALSAVNQFWSAAAKDLMETWPWILVCIGGAMVVSFLYIIVMRWISGIMVWFSILACLGLLAFCTYTSWTKYDELRTATDNMNSTTTRSPKSDSASDIIVGAIEDQLNSYLRMKETWLAFLIISAALLVILLLIVIFLRSRIVLAIALINEGSRAVAHSWSTLYFPIFPWAIQIGVICYGVAICLFLFTSGVALYQVGGLELDPNCYCDNDYKNGSFCTENAFAEHCKTSTGPCTIASCRYVENESQNFTIYLQLYNLFVFFWALFFVSALGQMILASTFATYYWTFHKEDIPYFMVATSAWRVFRYHLGTVAFGSLLLAVVNWLRALLEIANKYLNKYDNGFVRAVKCCMRCFFWCLEKFLRFLNKNAYIMCAIHGKNFCLSAKDAFSLLLRNIARVFVLDKVTDFLFFISKLVITAGVGAASFYIFSRPVIKLQDTGDTPYQSSYYFVPMFFTCIGAYFISSIFFSVYSMAVDTLFLCFLEDCDINDGSAEKPFFMSKNLMSILGKKNKTEAK